MEDDTTMGTARELIARAMMSDARLQFRRELLSDFPDAQLYLVGGAVRDAMLHRENKDFDFVVRGVAREQIEEWFGARGDLDLTGRGFGVYKFKPRGLPNHSPAIDIALPRTEHATADNRGGYREFDVQSDPELPIEEDLGRRDFTVNAMAYDVRADALVDPYHGAKDVKDKLIRAVGAPPERFREDLSRVLRAVRFAAQLLFEIEPRTWASIKNVMPDITGTTAGGEPVIAREVMGAELAKALNAHPQLAANLLNASGAIRELLPVVHQRIMQDPEYLHPVLEAPRSIHVALPLLVRAVDATQVKGVLRGLGFDALPGDHPARVDVEECAWIVRELQQGVGRTREVPADLARFEKRFMNRRGAHLLEALEAVGEQVLANEIKRKRREILERWGAESAEDIPKLVSGSDVLNAGVEPGPRVREILEKIRAEQLAGDLMTRPQAVSRLKGIV